MLILISIDINQQFSFNQYLQNVVFSLKEVCMVKITPKVPTTISSNFNLSHSPTSQRYLEKPGQRHAATGIESRF